ncbi:MAG: hypothetical protein R3A44_30835 [Caldilineaceae bacterium]
MSNKTISHWLNQDERPGEPEQVICLALHLGLDASQCELLLKAAKHATRRFTWEMQEKSLRKKRRELEQEQEENEDAIAAIDQALTFIKMIQSSETGITSDATGTNQGETGAFITQDQSALDIQELIREETTTNQKDRLDESPNSAIERSLQQELQAASYSEDKVADSSEPTVSQQGAKWSFWISPSVNWKFIAVPVILITGGLLLYILMQSIISESLTINNKDGITIGWISIGSQINLIQPTSTFQSTTAITPTVTPTESPQATKGLGNLVADFSRATPSGPSKMSVLVTKTVTLMPPTPTEFPVQTSEASPTQEETVTKEESPVPTESPTPIPTQTDALVSEPPCEVNIQSPVGTWPVLISFRSVPDGTASNRLSFEEGDKAFIHEVSADDRWFRVETNGRIQGWADPQYFSKCIQTSE